MKAVVIGGHTRNIGKTSVMSALIHEFAPLNWTAVKITQYGHGICSLDGDPCGCAPEEHPFALTEETDPCGHGDTCRFLAAGARRSLWLRVRQGQLAGAVPLLIETIGSGDGWTMIESNSILEFLQPLLYLAVLDNSQRDFKPSALRALTRADALVPVGAGFDRSSGSAPWLGLDAALFRDKPTFPVPRTDYQNPALNEFIRQKLGTAAARASSAAQEQTWPH
jgi:hypothetical protein